MFLSILHHCSLQCFCYSSFLEVWRGELFLGGAHLPKFYARGLYTELRIRLHSDQIIRSRGFSCIGMLYEDLCLAHATQHSHSVRSSHWLEAGVCSAPACVPCPACWLLAYVWQHALSTLLGGFPLPFVHYHGRAAAAAVHIVSRVSLSALLCWLLVETARRPLPLKPQAVYGSRLTVPS